MKFVWSPGTKNGFFIHFQSLMDFLFSQNRYRQQTWSLNPEQAARYCCWKCHDLWLHTYSQLILHSDACLISLIYLLYHLLLLRLLTYLLSYLYYSPINFLECCYLDLIVLISRIIYPSMEMEAYYFFEIQGPRHAISFFGRWFPDMALRLSRIAVFLGLGCCLLIKRKTCTTYFCSRVFQKP